MKKAVTQCDLKKAISFLKHCLEKQAEPAAIKWLENKIEQIATLESDAIFFMTFSIIPNYFSKEIVKLSKQDLEQANLIHKHWFLNRWAITQVARTYLILNYILSHPNQFKAALDKTFNAADVQELIALYQALPLFPNPEKFLLHGTNGIRSNMISVFEAIALNNSYPIDYFNEVAWNQLVLKTLHVDSPIEQVIGLKDRANPTLALVLINTARERSSASRPIKPELWYLVGYSLDQKTLPALKSLLESNNPILQRGGILALNYCKLNEANELLKKYALKQNEIESDLNKLRIFERQLI